MTQAVRSAPDDVHRQSAPRCLSIPHSGAAYTASPMTCGNGEIFSTIGVTVSHAVEQPEPRQATAEEASLLGLRKAALVAHIRGACGPQLPLADREKPWQ